MMISKLKTGFFCGTLMLISALYANPAQNYPSFTPADADIIGAVSIEQLLTLPFSKTDDFKKQLAVMEKQLAEKNLKLSDFKKIEFFGQVDGKCGAALVTTTLTPERILAELKKSDENVVTEKTVNDIKTYVITEKDNKNPDRTIVFSQYQKGILLIGNPKGHTWALTAPKKLSKNAVLISGLPKTADKMCLWLSCTPPQSQTPQTAQPGMPFDAKKIDYICGGLFSEANNYNIQVKLNCADTQTVNGISSMIPMLMIPLSMQIGQSDPALLADINKAINVKKSNKTIGITLKFSEDLIKRLQTTIGKNAQKPNAVKAEIDDDSTEVDDD